MLIEKLILILQYLEVVCICVNYASNHFCLLFLNIKALVKVAT